MRAVVFEKDKDFAVRSQGYGLTMQQVVVVVVVVVVLAVLG